MFLAIEVNGEQVILDEQICKAYRFRKLPELDHAYYDDGERQFYMFNCPTLLEVMEQNDCMTIFTDYPSDNDYDAYVRCTMAHEDVDEELEQLDGP